MTQFSKSLIGAIGAVALITACTAADEDTNSPAAPKAEASLADTAYLDIVSFDETTGGVMIGNPDAELELVEYASLTCGHCKSFHEDVLPRIKEDYVATGKVRLVFQEFPTPPVPIAVAGFALARCTGAEGYLDVLDDFFAAQDDIFVAARAGTVVEELTALAERHGIGSEAFDGCTSNQEYIRGISASVTHGQSQGVNSTPTLILNGEKLVTAESRTADGLAAIIDAELNKDTIAEDTTEESSDAGNGSE